MRLLTALLIVGLAGTPAGAADPLAEARRLYNLGQYENAAKLAREAIKVTPTAESARLVLGRIYLERFRQSAEAEDLAQASEALKAGASKSRRSIRGSDRRVWRRRKNAPAAIPARIEIPGSAPKPFSATFFRP